MNTSEDMINKIIERINEGFDNNDNGCIRWKGNFAKGNPVVYINNSRLNTNSNRISVTKFLWEQMYPEDIPKSNKERFIRICNTDKCLNIDHIKLDIRKKTICEINKQEYWQESMLPKCEQQDECLIWNGRIQNDYGRVYIKKTSYSAHKISFWIHSEYQTPKDIPGSNEDGEIMVIRHLCGNSRCVNPEHLQLGTGKENMRDRNDHGTALIGEANPNSKITEELATQIKHSRYDKKDPNYKTQQERADMFNVSKNIIASIDANITWAHIANREGVLVDRREEISQKNSRLLKQANMREWTDDMWQKASEIINQKLTILDSITSEHVDSPCHEWTGLITTQGYGHVRIFGKQTAPHILACEIKNKQQRPKDMVTRHLCANKKCCNPDHLVFGTHSENSLDSIRHGSRAASVTNEEIVREIRQTLGKDGLTRKERAEKYGLTTDYLREIENNLCWKHVIVD